MRPAVRAASVASRNASTESPTDAPVALHVTTVTLATITSAITAPRRRRNEGQASRDTGDAREPSSAVAMSQGDCGNLDSIRSQRRASVVEGKPFRFERPFPASLKAARSTSNAWAISCPAGCPAKSGVNEDGGDPGWNRRRLLCYVVTGKRCRSVGRPACSCGKPHSVSGNLRLRQRPQRARRRCAADGAPAARTRARPVDRTARHPG
jgi:hypothetical protein